MRVLVTGATGFVGQTLCRVLCEAGFTVRVAIRPGRALAVDVPESVVIDAIGATTDWRGALQNVDAVMHIAARAHVLERASRSSDLYMETNARGTLRLASAAAEAGVRRFVFLSSVKVNGEETGDRGYTALDVPNPQDAYGASKWLAEQSVMEVAGRSRMETAIVRSPLVYGPGVRANFLRLMGWVDRGWPLPLASIDNKRSLVSIWNLCSMLLHLLVTPAAAGRTWMVSDREDLSTPELIRRIGVAMNRNVRLLPVPVQLLRALGVLTGKRGEIARLCGSLVVDMRYTSDHLGWQPTVTVNEGLARTVEWYLSKGGHIEV
jgi:nucleoside-diphosphate-sugar epimerase